MTPAKMPATLTYSKGKINSYKKMEREMLFEQALD